MLTIRDLLESEVPEHCHHFFHHPDGSQGWLDWEIDSEVGEYCEKLILQTKEFLLNFPDIEAIPGNCQGVWEDVSIQCKIWAFS